MLPEYPGSPGISRRSRVMRLRAFSPRVVTVPGIVSDPRFEALEKAPAPIAVTVPGTV